MMRGIGSPAMTNDPYWPSLWPAEDGGPRRTQTVRRGPEPVVRGEPTVTSRELMVGTMAILRDPGEVYLLCHTGGDAAVSWVEQIHPQTLEVIRRSEDLPAGPTWPGGLAAHANGSLYVVFGRHVHKLSATLEIEASRELPRPVPYNSFVLLGDGTLATKNFGGVLPGHDPDERPKDTEMLFLSPEDLSILATVVLPEASIARLSATDDDVYVVGVDNLWRVHWDAAHQHAERDDHFVIPYRREGEGYGWDPVVTSRDIWFLNNGEGSEKFNGALRSLGVATVPQCLVRINSESGDVRRYDVTSETGGLVANPPAIDTQRNIAVGYDSSNAVVTGWSFGDEEPRVLWTRSLGHGSHPMVLAEQGIVVLGDFQELGRNEDLVFLDVATGDEVVRATTGSPIQSVLFGTLGFSNDVYICSFLAITRVAFS